MVYRPVMMRNDNNGRADDENVKRVRVYQNIISLSINNSVLKYCIPGYTCPSYTGAVVMFLHEQFEMSTPCSISLLYCNSLKIIPEMLRVCKIRYISFSMEM